MRKARDILVLVVFALPILSFAFVNRFLLLLGDLLGLIPLAIRARIAIRYLPDIRRRRGSSCEQEAIEARRAAVLEELERDGYDSAQATQLCLDGRLGIRIPHKSARNHASGKKKYALYLEGGPYEWGRFTGILCAQELRDMCGKFVKGVVFDFMGEKGNSFLGGIISAATYRLARSLDATLDPEIRAEIFGIWDGYRLAALSAGKGLAGGTLSPQLRVAALQYGARAGNRSLEIQDLFALNYGIDVILSFAYAGVEPILKFLGIRIKDYAPPMACNSFSVSGASAGGGHFFGRDFMFPTVGVFEDAACHVVLNRLPEGDSVSDPLALVRAPGMVGAVTAVNSHGQAMGTDMVPGRNCRWYRLGLNSLLMVRHAVGKARTVRELLRVVALSKRGVSWLYPFADRDSGRGGTIESGANYRWPRFRRYTPRYLRRLLPDRRVLRQNRSTRWRRGIMVREAGYQVPEIYQSYNRALFEHFGKEYVDSAWGERGFLLDSPHANGIPAAYYFPPLRMQNPELSLVTNQYQIPEMRLFQMNEWSVQVPQTSREYSDFQWRYDALNEALNSELDRGPLDEAAARRCISFLRPFEADGRPAPHWSYYGKDREGRVIPREKLMVKGCTSLLDLGEMKLSSLYGHWADEWVELSFGRLADALARAGASGTMGG